MITLLTLNVRIQTRFDGPNAFVRRQDALLDTLRAQAADVLAFQEVTCPMLDTLHEGLPGYALLATSSHGDPLRGEYTAIAYRRDTMALQQGGTFWLSPDERRPGSRFALQSPDPRTCTWAQLRHRPTGVRLRYFNTHLDHLSPIARVQGLRIVLRHMAAAQARHRMPLFLGGDFNLTPRGRAYRRLLQMPAQGQPRLVDLSAHIGATFHGYGAMPLPVKLDYMLCDHGTARDAIAVQKLVRAQGGRYLSDHAAIRVDWQPGAPGETMPWLGLGARRLGFI